MLTSVTLRRLSPPEQGCQLGTKWALWPCRLLKENSTQETENHSELGRDEKGPRSGITLCSGGIDPSLFWVLMPGRVTFKWASGQRGGTATLMQITFLQVFFYTFILAAHGPKKHCLEKDMVGEAEWTRVNTVLLYKDMFIMHHKCSFPL